MKVALIFRGKCTKISNALKSAGQTVSGLDCFHNWNGVMLEDLKAHNIPYDVILISYPSQHLTELSEKMGAKEVITGGYSDQVQNLRYVANYMVAHKDEYDIFVLSRFDFKYKRRITTWPLWGSPNVVLTGRDIAWPSNRLYHDFLFVVGAPSASFFKTAADNATANGHEIGRNLYNMKAPMEIMYRDYYHATPHPLLSCIDCEDEPDLDNPLHADPCYPDGWDREY